MYVYVYVLTVSIIALSSGVLSAGNKNPLKCTKAKYKFITVSEGGKNEEACLKHKSDVHCKTLQYALDGCGNCTTIQVTYSHSLSAAVYVSRRHGIAVFGSASHPVVMSCSNASNASNGMAGGSDNDTAYRYSSGDVVETGGLALYSSTNVTFQNLVLENCSIIHGSITNSSSFTSTSAMYLWGCADVTLSDCGFHSSNGSGLTLVDSAGTTSVQNCRFFDNSNTKVSHITRYVCH